MKISYKKLTDSGTVTATEGCLYGYCLKSNASGAGDIVIKDGAVEVLLEKTAGATTSKTVFFNEPIQFTTSIVVTKGSNFSYITVFYTTA